MKVEIPEQVKIQAALIGNAALTGVEDGGDALYAAIAMFRRAMALNPLDLGYRFDLARFLIDIGEEEEAAELAAFILKHNENIAGCWQILHYIETLRGNTDTAVAYAKRAYEIEPSGARKWDLAAAYLRAGDFANGLHWYEFRNESLPSTGAAPDAPTWTGEKVGHLAIWPDQGYGDLIMFARFIPWARERCDKITLMVNPQLFSLMQGYTQFCDVVSHHPRDAKYDAQIRITSLALAYGCTIDNIPLDPGVLCAAPSTDTLPGGSLKIGIAWQGNPKFPNDKLRSIPFREFLPLASDPRNTLYSLQVGEPASCIAKARASRVVRDMSYVIDGEWTHTVALIQQLDLVVTSCTAIAHVAGAMGKPVYLMIPAFADWRWLSGRDDTPWYPHTKLFRQTKVGDWTSVVKRVSAAINQLHQGRALMHLVNRKIVASQQEYEPDVTGVMRAVLHEGDFVIDVGANVGAHTVTAAELVGPTGTVLAIEPGENNLPALRAAVGKHAAEEGGKVVIVARPAWAKEEYVTFYLNADNGGGNALWDPADWPGPHNPKSKELKQPVRMQATTLDYQSEACVGLERGPKLIKIDVEGAEQRVLEGAHNLLGRYMPPFIIAELHEFGLQSLGCTQESLRALMRGYGYSTFMLFSDGQMPSLIPDNVPIKTGLIINLLFSTPQAVGEAWGALDIRSSKVRPFYAYGVVPQKESAA